MASPTAPSTPRQPTLPHRSFTVPSRLADVSRSRAFSGTPEHDTVETLFVHHAGKIILFSPPYTASPRRTTPLASPTGDEESAGTLPWTTRTERVVAAGLLILVLVVVVN